MSAPFRRAPPPHLGPDAPHYESWFVKAHHPTEPCAFWLRHTVHQRPGEPQTASVWLHALRRRAPSGRAGKRPSAELRPRRRLHRHRQIRRRPGRAQRRGGARRRSTPTGLPRSRATTTELRHLPPRGCTSDAAEDEVGDAAPRRTLHRPPRRPRSRRLGRPGQPQLGRRARRALDLDALRAVRGPGRDTWLELALGRIKVGPVTAPWIASGALQIDGERHRLGGPQRTRATRVDERRPSRACHQATGSRSRASSARRASASSPGATPTPRVPSTTSPTPRSPTSPACSPRRTATDAQVRRTGGDVRARHARDRPRPAGSPTTTAASESPSVVLWVVALRGLRGDARRPRDRARRSTRRARRACSSSRSRSSPTATWTCATSTASGSRASGPPARCSRRSAA